MRSRDVRRHHEMRVKQRVANYYGGVFHGDARRLGKLAQTRTPCSCFMCGNPRKWEKQPTLGERRTFQRTDRDL